MENSSVILLVVAIAGGLFLLWIILYLIPVGLWFQALVSDVKISLLQLVLMRWRKVPPTVIVGAMIEGKKAGIELYRDLLEAHYLAGGHVPQVVHALVSAQKANIMLDFKMATAIDLAGRDSACDSSCQRRDSADCQSAGYCAGEHKAPGWWSRGRDHFSAGRRRDCFFDRVFRFP